MPMLIFLYYWLYDGVFGPGAGSFYMLAFISIGGLGIIQATAQTKLMNFSSNFENHSNTFAVL